MYWNRNSRMPKVSVITAILALFLITVISGSTVFAMDGDNVQPWQRSAQTHKANLENSIAYLEKLDTSSYTDESVSELKSAIISAKAVAGEDNLSASAYWSERNRLEHARSCLTARSTFLNNCSSMPFRELSKEEVVDEMGSGINLGNTMDGHSAMTPGELVWQPVTITKELIKSIHDAGYNTLRVPVTWGNMIGRDEDTGVYSINERWLTRVQEIVDYGISQDMYVIINIHHDGVNWNNGWFNIGLNDIDSVMEKYAAVWNILALRFKDYDEHLIFESMNEITCSVVEEAMWDGGGQNYDRDIIRNFNQLFVNTVRATGGNNSRRWLASVGHFASSAKVEMPDDPCNEGLSHQMFAAHIYNSISNLLSELDNMGRDYDCAMYLGEWSTYLGRDGRTASGYNDVSIAYDSQRVNRACKINGICPIVWNCGSYTNDDGTLQEGSSHYWNRVDRKPTFDTIIDGVMRGSYLSPDDYLPESHYDSSITHVNNTYITDIDCNDKINITAGTITNIDVAVTPEGTNDVLIWSVDDDSVATVSNGRLAAKRPGKAIVTVYAQNSVDYGYYGHYSDDPYENAVKKEIEVNVTPDNNSTVTGIRLPESLIVEEGKSNCIDIGLEGTGTTYISCTSSDESVATVNNTGRVFGKSIGNAVITVTTASGCSGQVKVIVKEMTRDRYINAALILYYNDSENNYYGNEMGKPVKIKEDGQYTVSFDVDEDMSAAGINAGIDTINHVGSIYVKDYDVYKGNILDSNATKARIRWDEIRINGEPAVIKEEYSDYFDALSKGVLDTGNPINTWSGSVIEGITLKGEHEAMFPQSEPYRIDVTFTISDIEWKSKEPEIITDTQVSQTSPSVNTNTVTTGGNSGVQQTVTSGNTVNNNDKSTGTVAKPSKVSGIKIKLKGKSGAKTRNCSITWKKQKNVRYQVEYRIVNKKAGKAKILTVKKNKTVIKKLKKGQVYRIRVRAYKSVGKKKVYGSWSKAVKKKI